MLAQEWFYGFVTRPVMSIKVERQLHDMRILGRVLCASGTRLATTVVATEMLGAVCQWHTFSTDRSEYEVRNNPYGIF